MSRVSSLLAGLCLAIPIAANAGAADRRAGFAGIVHAEAALAGLPAEVADAVMAVESGYDPAKVGSVGEVGLMQVRPSTAAMLGFKGGAADLAVPAANIHYGVTYLAGAWRRAHGDLCRALMKYRAGHGEEVMSPLSVSYCLRARAHLAAAGSALGDAAVPAATPPGVARPAPRRPGAQAGGAAFWAAHEARIRRINARIERRWRLMATR